MRALTTALIVTSMTLGACAGPGMSGGSADVDAWSGDLPISSPWLRDRLPAAATAYQRIPNPFGLLAMPKGNVFDAALSSDANIRNLNAILDGLEANLAGATPIFRDPRVVGVVSHLRSPIEIAVVSLLPMPSGMVAVTLDLRSNDELEALFADLAQYPPFPGLAGPLDDEGYGQLAGLPIPILLHFDAATGQLALYGGMAATRASFAALLAPAANAAPHPMRALENQIDSSGQGFFSWIDTSQALQTAAAFIPPNVTQILQRTGLDQLRSIAFGAGVADGKGRLKFVADLGTNSANRLLPIVDNHVSATSVGEPRGLFLLSIPGSMEFARLEDRILSLGAPTARESWDKAKAAFAGAVGVSIDELLSAVGPELVVIGDEAGDYIGLKVRDRDRLDAVLDKLAAKAGTSIQDHSVKGGKIRSLSLPATFKVPDEALNSGAAPFLQAMSRTRHRFYWLADGDYLYLASVPQLLMDRARLGARASVADWLAETQHVDMSGSVIGATGSVPGMPRKLYESYVGVMQTIADIVGADFDVWSMPTASQLALPDHGTLGFGINLGQPLVSIELSYESSPAELFAGGGAGAVAVAGVLAAIAIPAYQDYTIRAQVSEGLNLAAATKLAITQSYLSNGQAPADREAAGMTPAGTDTQGKYVASVDVDRGKIVIEYGNQANPRIAGRYVVLTPYQAADGGVVWVCGRAGPMPGLTPLGGGAEPAATTIEPKYLPSACR